MHSLEKNICRTKDGVWKIKVGKENRNVNTKEEGFRRVFRKLKTDKTTTNL